MLYAGRNYTITSVCANGEEVESEAELVYIKQGPKKFKKPSLSMYQFGVWTKKVFNTLQRNRLGRAYI